MFSPVRLVAGLLVLGLLMVPAYLLLIREPADASVQRAVFLEPEASQGLEVGLDEGDQAPDFEFSTPEGERVRLNELRGRPLVINFWATWCTSCLTEMPDLKALQEKLGRETFNVLAVNAGESRPDAEEFIDFLEAPFVYAMDPGLVLSDGYSVYGLPLSVFLDANGVVRGVYRGHANAEVLDTYVKAAIEVEPPGEIPVVLRIVTAIYRPRILTVSTTGPGNLTFESKSLRCDVSFCAKDMLLTGLKSRLGGSTVAYDGEGELPRVTVNFDATAVRDDEVVASVREILEGVEDPVYDRPIEIEFRGQD